MLKKLMIKNFAIIEDITIEFLPNMTVLTGQTGAGKSLIIDSIGLLLGERADSDMIRYGERKAIVAGEFDELNANAREILKTIGIDSDLIVITREINDNSKNNIKINGVAVNLSFLKNLGLSIADIHVQHDTFRLINPDTYLSLLDRYGDKSLNEVFNSYLICLDNFKEKKNKYLEILKKNKDLNEKIDLLKFQYDELKTINLVKGEYEAIEDQINKLSNFDRIYNNLNLAYEAIINVDNIYEAHDYLKKISSIDDKYLEYETKLSDFYYEIEEIRSGIREELDNLDFDPELLEELNTRHNDLKNIFNKYKMNEEELVKYFEGIKEAIMMNDNYDEYIKELENDANEAYSILIDKASRLTKERQRIAGRLEERLIKECIDLDLENIIFKISFTETISRKSFLDDVFLDSGIDKIDFLITLNKGEPLKPLSKVASGGELSRIMLGFKTIFAEIEKLSLMVFDEIDSGISGEAAVKMASKIYKISQVTQVLCITHLPNVAAIANNHLHIYKIDENDRTKTGVNLLSFNERVKEIAMMISGKKITSFALENAKELLSESIPK